MSELADDRKVIIIGAGPAGLTAAYCLAEQGISSTIIEKLHIVGGIARTENYRNFLFDMGGHRFFTKSAQVKVLWKKILGDRFVTRPRVSRIFYKGKFFDYPLRPLNVLMGLGAVESSLILLSYVRWRLFPFKHENTFEEWVTNRFGRRLFSIFFRAYTEKVWGIPCSELSAEWAAQRIKDLSLKTAILSMFVKPKRTITTLIEQFEYPRQGPGMMWDAARKHVELRGSEVRVNREVVEILREGNRIEGVVVQSVGGREIVTGTDFIGSMPLTEFVKRLTPPPPPDVLHAAANLHYRDFLTVCLIIDVPELFKDNWIYVHDPDVKVGRIQNFNNWSADMVPEQGKTSLGLEYFCTEGDELWSMRDEDLITLAKCELEQIGLAAARNVTDGCVFRVEKAYPIYEGGYREYLSLLKDFVGRLENFQTIGRNGLHRYNNQDHAMLTGILAVRNLLYGERNDIWNVNTEQEYHEEVIEMDATEALQTALAEAFQKMDPVALGLSIGVWLGILLFGVTMFLALQGDDHVGASLSLLGHFLPGYNVSLNGSLLGCLYGFTIGFIIAWSFAFLRNVSILTTMKALRRRARRNLRQKVLLSI